MGGRCGFLRGENQEKILQRVADFAIKHKLKWGASKCEVMRVGKHKDEKKDWELGEITIKETESWGSNNK